MGLRAFWLGPALWAPTGYGMQARRIVPRLAKLPEVEYIAVACQAGLAYGGLVYMGIPHWPLWALSQTDAFLRGHLREARADTVIALLDAWVLPKDTGRDLSQGSALHDRLLGAGWPKTYRFLPYVPIDSAPVSEENLAVLRNAHTVLVNSRFGERALREAGLDNVRYVPHVIEASVFRPPAEGRRARAELTGFPEETFVVGMVAANKGRFPMRKGFDVAFQAFRQFAEGKRDVGLFVWTNYAATALDEADLLRTAAAYRLEGLVKFPTPYRALMGIPEEELAGLYGCFDVLLSASLAESVNVPLLEAQACGVPIVATHAQGQAEHVGAGWLVEGSGTYIATPQSQLWEVPSAARLAEALETAYRELQSEARRRELSQKAREFALAFDADRVVREHWQPLLRGLASGLAHKLLVPRKGLYLPNR